ncbi:hypothetical protein FRC08_010624 [Ceratobasidium sp. 394]|nr:hypothetical protein FRC08_010624 [Ceratobasidium sp. 394]KAG9101305.1 hypothetical protein FS749_008025 [Ceratobasidium sp. UAMH 11750]
MPQSFPKKSRLRLGFVAVAVLAQILAPKIPAFDTSHLIHPSDQNAGITKTWNVLGFIDTSSQSKVDSVGSKLSLDPGSPSPYVPRLIDFSGLRWDALHYNSVALHGLYIFEHQYAFSPGVPIMLRLVHLGKLYLFRLVDYFHIETWLSHNLAASIWRVSAVTAKAGLIGLLACEPCLEIYK